MSGKAKKIEVGTLTLLPAKKGTCPDCAVVHEPEMPHNPESLYYQVKFLMKHGRDAKWSDAMAHCTDAVKAYWKEALLKKGVSEDQFTGGEA